VSNEGRWKMMGNGGSANRVNTRNRLWRRRFVVLLSVWAMVMAFAPGGAGIPTVTNAEEPAVLSTAEEPPTETTVPPTTTTVAPTTTVLVCV